MKNKLLSGQTIYRVYIYSAKPVGSCPQAKNRIKIFRTSARRRLSRDILYREVIGAADGDSRKKGNGGRYKKK